MNVYKLFVEGGLAARWTAHVVATSIPEACEFVQKDFLRRRDKWDKRDSLTILKVTDLGRVILGEKL